MIKFAFWGQNQSSFQKACKVIEEVYNIQISYVTVKDVTEHIGNLLFKNLLDNANKIWNSRADIKLNNKKDKLILYIESDGASVNTRIEDENGSTWKENKLAIFFDDKDIYKRKNHANMIQHKEFVSYLGSVDEFRILLF